MKVAISRRKLDEVLKNVPADHLPFEKIFRGRKRISVRVAPEDLEGENSEAVDKVTSYLRKAGIGRGDRDMRDWDEEVDFEDGVVRDVVQTRRGPKKRERKITKLVRRGIQNQKKETLENSGDPKVLDEARRLQEEYRKAVRLQQKAREEVGLGLWEIGHHQTLMSAFMGNLDIPTDVLPDQDGEMSFGPPLERRFAQLVDRGHFPESSFGGQEILREKIDEVFDREGAKRRLEDKISEHESLHGHDFLNPDRTGEGVMELVKMYWQVRGVEFWRRTRALKDSARHRLHERGEEAVDAELGRLRQLVLEEPREVYAHVDQWIADNDMVDLSDPKIVKEITNSHKQLVKDLRREQAAWEKEIDKLSDEDLERMKRDTFEGIREVSERSDQRAAAVKDMNEHYRDHKREHDAAANLIDLDRDERRLAELVEEAGGGRDLTMVVSRAPIDVLRMSDHPHARSSIQSCHSVGGSYFHCAVDETTKGGAIAYLVETEDLEGVDLEDDEIFLDKSRGVDGVKPYGRVRLHRFEDAQGNEIAVPAKRNYGDLSKSFDAMLRRWAWEQQPDLRPEDLDTNKLKLQGGHYLDDPASGLFAAMRNSAPERPAREEETQVPEGDFWGWVTETHPKIPNPNPDGRQRDITPSTLKGYAEGDGPHAQRAQRVVEALRTKWMSSRKVASAWGRSRVKVAISRKKLNEVLKIVPADHLPFEKIFRGRKRIPVRVDPARLANKDAQSRGRVSELLEAAGVSKEAEVDFEDGVVRDVVETRRGPKRRERKITKLVRRGIQNQRKRVISGVDPDDLAETQRLNKKKQDAERAVHESRRGFTTGLHDVGDYSRVREILMGEGKYESDLRSRATRNRTFHWLRERRSPFSSFDKKRIREEGPQVFDKKRMTDVLDRRVSELERLPEVTRRSEGQPDQARARMYALARMEESGIEEMLGDAARHSVDFDVDGVPTEELIEEGMEERPDRFWDEVLSWIRDNEGVDLYKPDAWEEIENEHEKIIEDVRRQRDAWRRDVENLSEEDLTKMREDMEEGLARIDDAMRKERAVEEEVHSFHMQRLPEEKREKDLPSWMLYSHIKHHSPLWKAAENLNKLDRDERRLAELVEKAGKKPDPLTMVVSRAPIDVVRMSDHPHARSSIQSCHSVGGSYFHCAVDETTKGGAVAYLVATEDLEGVDLEDDEIFLDKERDVDGVKPYGRVRLHRFEDEDGNEIAVPAKRNYGDLSKSFDAMLRSWAWEQQPDLRPEDLDTNKLKLRGGQYLDDPASGLFAAMRNSAPEKPEETQVPEGDFWSWVTETHPKIPNPNPDGRQRDITPSTLKGYAEGDGPHAQRAQRAVEALRTKWMSSRKVASAWGRSRVRVAISQKKLDEVLKDVPADHLPFEKIFRGRKRIPVKVDPARLANKDDFSENIVRRHLEAAGVSKEAEVDFEDGVVRDVVETRRGPKRRERKITKLVRRGIQNQRKRVISGLDPDDLAESRRLRKKQTDAAGAVHGARRGFPPRGLHDVGDYSRVPDIFLGESQYEDNLQHRMTRERAMDERRRWRTPFSSSDKKRIREEGRYLFDKKQMTDILDRRISELERLPEQVTWKATRWNEGQQDQARAHMYALARMEESGIEEMLGDAARHIVDMDTRASTEELINEGMEERPGVFWGEVLDWIRDNEGVDLHDPDAWEEIENEYEQIIEDVRRQRDAWRRDVENLSEEDLTKMREDMEEGFARLDEALRKEKAVEEEVKSFHTQHLLEKDKKDSWIFGIYRRSPLYKAADNLNRLDRDERRLAELVEKAGKKPNPLTMVVSRAPIDVLRMSDHPHARSSIQSCHSVGGSYFHCAVDETMKGGAIAYLVDTGDLEGVDLEDDEIFLDKSRGVDGVKPYGRVRLHRFEDEDGNEIAVPAKRNYGDLSKGFDAVLRSWAWEQQPDLRAEDLDTNKLKLRGGSYLDDPAFGLFAAMRESAPERPERPARPEETQVPEGDFWGWVTETHPKIPNPNPDGRQRDITPSTLKSYAEGGGPHAQRAQRVVEALRTKWMSSRKVASAWGRSRVTVEVLRERQEDVKKKLGESGS